VACGKTSRGAGGATRNHGPRGDGHDGQGQHGDRDQRDADPVDHPIGVSPDGYFHLAGWTLARLECHGNANRDAQPDASQDTRSGTRVPVSAGGNPYGDPDAHVNALGEPEAHPNAHGDLQAGPHAHGETEAQPHAQGDLQAGP
jgi:hypothetical protein